MTRRTREWMKLGGLVGAALVLAIAFAGAVNVPRVAHNNALAQQALANLAPRRAPVIPAARSVADMSDGFAAVAEQVRPAVVFIEADQVRRAPSRPQNHPPLPAPFDQMFPQFDNPQQPRMLRGEGSGFIISRDGYILTNNHVVDEADRLTVKLIDKRTFKATVVGRDPETDVAVIKIDASGLPTVSLGNSDSTRIGEWVLAVGNPLGEAFAFTVTAGIVSAKGRNLRDLQRSQYSIGDFIQTDAAINPGNSGGPLVNVHGQVIGINSAIASPTGTYAGYGFAIPINLVRTVSEQLIAHGKVTRAVLGVAIRDADPEDAAYVGLDSISGVVVQDYSNDASPAKRAGIQPGDVIVAIDGEPVEYTAQLQQIVGFKHPGEKVDLTVVRNGGHRLDLRVTLAARADTTEKVAANTGKDSGGGSSYEDKLGLTVQPLSAAAGAAADAQIPEEHRGLLISAVDPDGPAAEKGLGRGQIITHVDGQRVHTMDEFQKAMAAVKDGDVVSLQFSGVGADGQWTSYVVRVKAGG
jgi:serine protease Do